MEEGEGEGEEEEEVGEEEEEVEEEEEEGCYSRLTDGNWGGASLKIAYC